MVEYIEGVKKDREEHLFSIKEQKEIETKILQAREAINNHLDLLQKTWTDAINLSIDKENKDIHQFLKSVEKNERDIKEFQSIHLKIKQHASELQTFLTLKHVERDIAIKEEFIQSLNKTGSLHHHRFSLMIDTTLKKCVSNVKRFGEVVTETRPTDIPFLRQKAKEAQLMIPVPEKSIDDLTLVQSFNTHSREVRGCTMLPGDRMVLPSRLCYSCQLRWIERLWN